MHLPDEIAQRFAGIYFGQNWTNTNIEAQLKETSWQEAVKCVETCNTILALTYHMDYYVQAISRVLRGHALDAHDRYSFDHPAIQHQQEWQDLCKQVLANARQLEVRIRELPADRLQQPFTDPRYGTYYHNLLGVTEHCSYHLGQIVLLRKLLAARL